jgi:hypothetical protein
VNGKKSCGKVRGGICETGRWRGPMGMGRRAMNPQVQPVPQESEYNAHSDFGLLSELPVKRYQIPMVYSIFIISSNCA